MCTSASFMLATLTNIPASCHTHSSRNPKKIHWIRYVRAGVGFGTDASPMVTQKLSKESPPSYIHNKCNAILKGNSLPSIRVFQSFFSIHVKCTSLKKNYVSHWDPFFTLRHLDTLALTCRRNEIRMNGLRFHMLDFEKVKHIDGMEKVNWWVVGETKTNSVMSFEAHHSKHLTHSISCLKY